MGNDAEIEEERRVLYVALTRAQDELILSNGGNNGGFIGFQTKGSGDFFLERVPDNLLDHEGQSTPLNDDALELDDLAGWD